MKKILSTFILITILVLPLSATAHKQNSLGQTYSDVMHTNPNYDIIDYLTYIGVVKGSLSGNFNPYQSVTNKQVALMLVRALNEQNRQSYKNPNYKDVNASDNGYKEIAIATDLGIFPKEKYFHPNKPITREDMARAITRAFNLKSNTSHTFNDVPTNYWAYNYISTLAHYNITTGYDDGTFRPKQHLTRSHFAAFVARALLPEIRPNSNLIYYNDGLMPKKSIKSQSFILAQHSTITNITHFDFIKNEALNSQQDIIIGNSFEGQQKMYVNTPDHFTMYTPIPFQIPYPIYKGKKWLGNTTIPGLTITYTVETNQGIAVLPHAIYKDVIKINAKYSTVYGDYAPETFWFAQGHGFIRSMISDGFSFIEETKY